MHGLQHRQAIEAQILVLVPYEDLSKEALDCVDQFEQRRDARR